MQLMNDVLQKRFAEVGSQKDVLDPLVLAMYKADDIIWYITEYSPVEQTLYGYFKWHGYSDLQGWAYTSLSKLENHVGRNLQRMELSEVAFPISTVLDAAT